MGERTTDIVVDDQEAEEVMQTGGEQEVVRRLQSVQSANEIAEINEWDADAVGIVEDVRVVDDPSDELLEAAGISYDHHWDKSGYGKRASRKADELYEEVGEAIDMEGQWTADQSVVVIEVEAPSGDVVEGVFKMPKTTTDSDFADLCEALDVEPLAGDTLVGERIPLEAEDGVWEIVIPSEKRGIEVERSEAPSEPMLRVMMVGICTIFSASLVIVGLASGSAFGVMSGLFWLLLGALHGTQVEL